MTTRYDDLGPELLVEQADGVCTITLNRPEERNAIDAAMHKALAHVWRRIGDDEDTRVALLLGSGPVFTAGGDFSWFEDLRKDRRALEESFVHGQRILDDLIRLPIPLVAGIRGAAVGLGASLGVLADIVVMSDDGFYRDPHASIGLVAGDGGVAAWPMSVPLQIAKEYLLLGDRLGAKKAEMLGMVNRVVPSDQVDAEARRIAERLVGLPRAAVAHTKRALNLHLERAARGVIEFGLATEALGYASEEFQQQADERAARARRRNPDGTA